MAGGKPELLERTTYPCCVDPSEIEKAYYWRHYDENACRTGHSPKGPLELVEREIPEPGAGAVRIKFRRAASATATR